MGKDKADIKEILKESKKLPRFEDGRIDYSKADKAPVLIVFIQDPEGKILLLRRSEKVMAYRGMWSSLAGFIDEDKPIKEKVLEELSEELEIKREMIEEMVMGENYEYHDVKKKRTWWRFPVLVKLKLRPEIKLDWEHTELKWVKLGEVSKYEMPPGTEESLMRLIGI